MIFFQTCHHVNVAFPLFVQGQLPGTDGSGCRQAAISAAQAFDDSESVEEVKALLQETWGLAGRPLEDYLVESMSFFRSLLSFLELTSELGSLVRMNAVLVSQLKCIGILSTIVLIWNVERDGHTPVH